MNEPRRERKVVTIVFCDLVGFTSRAESMDPEDVEAILRPYHARVREELERYGGTVEKFIGDAVMALFGAPIAHEDDPERAVRAALAIRDFATDDGLELRVGITTGEALVQLDAQPDAGEGMASGDVVNTAARLQSAAPVNGVLVDETTFRATRSTVDYEDAEAVEAKGKTEPIAVWEAQTAHSRFGVDVAHEARAELVGRERELSVIRDAFERARHERTPQLLTLVGVPGIGKSRLVYELSRIADADPELVTWRQGRCLAYGDGVTLWALSEIVKAQAAIVEQDTPAEVEQKLRDAVADVLADTGDANRVESQLRSLVGLSAESELGDDRRQSAFAAWRRFLEAMAEQRPLVVVFEDLHWADESLLDFVDELVDWVTDVPLLAVATARPELLDRRPGWGGGKLNATTLALPPLSEEQTSLLIAQLLERSVLPAESQHMLLERAGGNPLYAEQFAELFLERGSADELGLPETLQGIIAARLDGLANTEKDLLHDAAVIGKVFWASAVHNGPDASTTLHSLERKGFVRRQKRSSVEGETEFAFAHDLVRDVAYGQIARADRVEKHRHAGEWIESLGRPEDHAEMLAYHWRSALELARAAGQVDDELTEHARIALREAGDRAFALNAYPAAQKYYEDALVLWSDEDPERPEVLFSRAHALLITADERRVGALEEARDALMAVGDTTRAGEAECLLANVAWERGQGELRRERLRRAEELVGKSITPSAARVLGASARMRVLDGENEEGLRIGRAALEMSDDLALDELRAHALTTIGMAKNSLEGGAAGIAEMERGLAVALEAGSPIASWIVMSLSAMMDDDLARADELNAEALLLAERFGNHAGLRFARANQIWIDFMRGRWERAFEASNAFIAECEAGTPHVQELTARQIRAAFLESRGDVAGALADHVRAVELARGRDSGITLLVALPLAAAAYADHGELDEGRLLAAEIPSLVEEFGPIPEMFPVALFAVELGILDDLRAALETRRGLTETAWHRAIDLALAGDLNGAADVMASTGNLTREAYARRRAGIRSIAEGRLTDAGPELERAVTFYREVGANYYVHEAEKLLAQP